MTATGETMKQPALAERVRRLPWYHQIDLGDGLITPGRIPIGTLRAQAEIYFRDGVSGKSVIDIGCWDGYNSFEAEARGARRVLATDHEAWGPGSGGSPQSFELAREALGSRVESMDLRVDEVVPERVGKFDVVLFLGVLYHLRNPFLGLERAASVCTQTLVVETHLDAWFNWRPAMIFYPGSTLNNDPTNWWGPNKACVREMLRDLGFKAQFARHPTSPRRGIFFGHR
jgi:tRNA (mo5U34)-methyltransferase